MIDINKVTHTRAGYPVHNIRRYNNVSTTYPILADVEFAGEIEPESFTEDGKYYNRQGDTGYDLVENKETTTETLISKLDKIAFSLSVVLQELEDIRRN